MGANFQDANNTNIDKAAGNWLIHCKYKKGARKEGQEKQNVAEEIEDTAEQVNDTEINSDSL